MRSPPLVAVALALSACGPGPILSARPSARDRVGPPDVVLVVLDDVRSDQLALCGADRPTSSTLEALVKRGAAYTCDAYAPASWTLPSHAGLFTGEETFQHGADMVPVGNVTFPWKTSARALPASARTLAEEFADRGYQTVLVSGNPVLSEQTGLVQGFETVRRGGVFGELSGARYEDALDGVLREVSPDRPLFLVLNIADAHMPWEAVPEGVGWVPPQPGLAFRGDQVGDPMNRFMRKSMPEAEATPMLRHLRDVYDYGVWRADATLGRAVERLEAAGRLKEGDRLVVTSDHGEFLGQHDLLGHNGHRLYEDVVRVPLLALVVGGAAPPLPDPVSMLVAHDLALDGTVGERPVRSTAFPAPFWTAWFGNRFGQYPGAAAWRGRHKVLWLKGEPVAFDLAADPGEAHGQPADDADPLVPEVRALAEKTLQAARGGGGDAGATELLQALGYVK